MLTAKKHISFGILKNFGILSFICYNRDMDEVQIEPKPRKSAPWWKKLRYSYRSIPDKKQYIEFFTALLSVPVLLTVILLNVNNLRAKDKPTEPSPAPSEKIIYISPSAESEKNSVTPSGDGVCKKELPPVSIQYPQEGDTIEDNPLKISITYPKNNNFCAIVWSYRINNGTWSDFDDNSIALYNLSSGKITFDLRVKSIATGEGMTLRRTFQYINTSITPDATSSDSARTQ
jgi:hypothetical protein